MELLLILVIIMIPYSIYWYSTRRVRSINARFENFGIRLFNHIVERNDSFSISDFSDYYSQIFDFHWLRKLSIEEGDCVFGRLNHYLDSNDEFTIEDLKSIVYRCRVELDL